LFFLGDLINKRKRSLDVLRFIKKRGNCYILKGNHEHFFIEYFYNNQLFFKDQIESIGGKWCIEEDSNLMFEYADWLNEECQLFIEIEYRDKIIGLVHADVPNDNWTTMKDDLIINWRNMIFSFRRFNDYNLLKQSDMSEGEIKLSTDDIIGIDGVIFGHTPVETITKFGNSLYIDTGSYFKNDYYNEGKISCVELSDAYHRLFK
jgi:serine/threonine protein phosphatase 1